MFDGERPWPGGTVGARPCPRPSSAVRVLPPPETSDRRLRRAIGWVGYALDDVFGRRCGEVAGVLVDREQGTPLWLLVRLRAPHRHVVVPLEPAVAGARHVMVPFPHTLLRALPGVPADGALTARAEADAAAPFPAMADRGRLPRWERRRTTARAFVTDDGVLAWDPAPRGGAPAPAGRPVPPGRVPHRPTVVVVDDHPGFRALVKAALHDEGFVVLGEAGDGARVVADVLALHPDLLVLDVVLPHLTAVDVLEALDAVAARTRVLATSGHDGAAALLATALHGRGRYVAKAEGVGALVAAAHEVCAAAAVPA